ncbi:MAG TPA: efflux transporter outer membrane subunit [Novosphingobium sp.]|nr:efflux transporter outer membrane subunit [Novosphingobium sp.]
MANKLRKGRAPLGVALLTSALLGGCVGAPAYHPVKVATPAQFSETPDGWAAAQPADGAARGPWWQVFADPQLDRLEQQAEKASPTLEAALARYDEARATARVADAARLPEVDAVGSAARDKVSQNRPLTTGREATYNDYRAGGLLTYELDLWGRVRAAARAGHAEADASGHDLAAARLSLQAAVADAYVRLRGLDAQASLLRRNDEAYSRAYQLTATRHQGGIASIIDVNRASMVLANARAQLAAVEDQRAATEHEIAALVGAVASNFHLAAVPDALRVPLAPATTPSVMLQRRPDVAAAERRMAAANARVGAARAALFPTITLGLTGGYETTGPSMFSAPNAFWGLGPASVSLPVFDGGKRRAQLRSARAQYDEVAATYRSTVLTAFREVEDQLAASRLLAHEATQQSLAADAAQHTSDLSFTRYREGATDYFEVVTAQTDALNAQRTLLAVQTQRLQAAIALVKALGGDPAPALGGEPAPGKQG